MWHQSRWSNRRLRWRSAGSGGRGRRVWVSKWLPLWALTAPHQPALGKPPFTPCHAGWPVPFGLNTQLAPGPQSTPMAYSLFLSFHTLPATPLWATPPCLARGAEHVARVAVVVVADVIARRQVAADHVRPAVRALLDAAAHLGGCGPHHCGQGGRCLQAPVAELPRLERQGLAQLPGPDPGCCCNTATPCKSAMWATRGPFIAACDGRSQAKPSTAHGCDCSEAPGSTHPV